ncbi:MAG TPA: trehalose-phosphatase, partial [Mycobacteriales bacterium]|nr:trehalose-phosphatase [Mycobacteriales bacterium]
MDGPGQAGWDAIVSAPERALIALDYDGVLAPIVSDPGAAVPLPGSVAALMALAEAPRTAVAV